MKDFFKKKTKISNSRSVTPYLYKLSHPVLYLSSISKIFNLSNVRKKRMFKTSDIQCLLILTFLLWQKIKIYYSLLSVPTISVIDSIWINNYIYLGKLLIDYFDYNKHLYKSQLSICFRCCIHLDRYFGHIYTNTLKTR